MHFQTEHRFHGRPEDVARVLADPLFYEELELPDLGKPQVLEHRSDGDDALVKLRYEFLGKIDMLARALLGGQRLIWVQEVRVNLRSGSGELRFEGEGEPRRLHGQAGFDLVPEGDGTVRRLEGDLVVAVPGIGPMAEQRIVPGLLGRLDIEAAAVEARLTIGGGGRPPA